MLGTGSTFCEVDLLVPDGVLARLPDHVEYWSLIPTPESLVLGGRREMVMGLAGLEVTREPGRAGTGGMSSVGESNFATKSLIDDVLDLIAVSSAGVDLDASIDPLREVVRPEV